MQAWVGQPSTAKSSTWVTTADKAQTEFEKEIARLKDPALKPVLAKVFLVQDGQATVERFVVTYILGEACTPHRKLITCV